jgi:hypothetical protein
VCSVLLLLVLLQWCYLQLRYQTCWAAPQSSPCCYYRVLWVLQVAGHRTRQRLACGNQLALQLQAVQQQRCQVCQS